MADFDFTSLSAHDRYNLIIGLVTPRPIALITTLDAAGQVNAAPFSAFNYAGVDPVLVTIGVGNRPAAENSAAGVPVPKDTAQNIRLRGEFVINVVNEQIVQAMNVCAVDFPAGVDELSQAGLTTAASSKIAVPRIAEAPACLECREVITIERGRSRIVIGEVVHAFVRDDYVDTAGPYIHADLIHSVGRMNGGGNYIRTRDAIFQLPRIPYKDWLARKSNE